MSGHTYRWICRECNALRSFSYRDTAAIAARVHAHEFGHTVKVEWWANFRPHTVIFPPTKAAPAPVQRRLFT